MGTAQQVFAAQPAAESNQPQPSQSQTAAQAVPNIASEQHGSIWRNILMGALAGLASGSQARNGAGFAGGMGLGAGAAEQQQQQQQAFQQQQAEAKQRQQEEAQDAQDRHSQYAANAQLAQFGLVRAKAAAEQAGIDLSREGADNLNAISQVLSAGGQKVGSGTEQELISSVPDAAQGVSNGTLRFFPDPQTPGQYVAYRVTPDWLHSTNTEPLTVNVQTGVEDGKPTYVTRAIPAGTIQNGDYLNLVGHVTANGLKSQTALATNAATVAGRSQDAKARAAATVRAAQVRAAASGSGGAGQLGLKNLSPDDIAGLVDGIGTGTLDASNLLRYGKADSMKLLAMVKQKYPNFDEALYKTRLQTAKAFSPGGKESTNLQSFDQFLGHVDEALPAIDAARNSSQPWLNTPINELQRKTGDPNISRMVAALMPVREELQRFLSGNKALTVDEIAEGQKALNANLSPAQFEAVLKQFVGTAAVRLRAMNDQYRRVMGKNIPDALSPQSQATLRSAGFGSILADITGNGQQQNPGSHVFSVSAWQKANPNGDANAARTAAQNAGYKVVR